jgi:hypothetical protein
MVDEIKVTVENIKLLLDTYNALDNHCKLQDIDWTPAKPYPNLDDTELANHLYDLIEEQVFILSEQRKDKDGK